MDLTITPELIRDLYDYAGRTGRPDQTGIVLTADGWITRVWTDASNAPADGLAPITADGVNAWLDGEDLDDDCAAALAVPDGDSGMVSYTIRDEYGNDDTAPGADTDPQVVTGDLDADGDVQSEWAAAWWFDLTTARQIVAEAGRLGDGASTVYSLWRTESGRWVQHARTITGDGLDTWTALSDTQAATRVYTADPDLVVPDGPVVVQAALLARQLVDLLATPALPGGDRPVRARADDVLPALTEMVHASKAVSELLRGTVLGDLRTQRGTAAYRVGLAFATAAAAAEHLGMHPTTYSNLAGDDRD